MLQNFQDGFGKFFKNDAAVPTEELGFTEPKIGSVIYAASFVVNILALALPLSILQIYDRVLPNEAFDTLTVLVSALVAVIVVDFAIKYLRSLIINWSAASFTHKLSVRALSKMLASTPSQFSRKTTSEHLERLGAVSGLGNHIGGQSRIVAVDILFIPVFAGVIMLVGGAVFSVILTLFAIFAYLTLKRTSSLNKVVSEREDMEARKYDFLIEALGSMQTIKAHAMEPLIMRRFERLQSAASIVTRRMISLTSAAQIYNTIYASLSVIMIVGIGAVFVINGRLTLGALACCMLLSSQLLQPLMRSFSAWNEIQLAKHRRARIAAIFDDKEGPIDTSACGVVPKYNQSAAPKAIAFKNITLRRGKSRLVFDNLTLDFQAGATIALRGEDGSGRTTLLRALMGDVALDKGSITIGDVEMTASCDNPLRPIIRYIGPNPVMFRGSVIDNLTLFGGLPANVSLWASKFIGLDDEVVRMPLGYDTVLKSAAGKDIPPAMAQRICIARALATRPSVLILDEANILLDMAGEKSLCEALRKLRGKITIILATHRPSFLRLADVVYDIQNGQVRPANQAAAVKVAL